ncbi:MAG: GntR family transcriptional regulator [Lepagella sp.]
MEYNDSKPIYLQLADRLMNDVGQDASLCGQRIPSVRDFAAQCGVNANTVMRTYTWLQQKQIITNKRGIGYYYSEEASEIVLKERRETFLTKEIDYFIERLEALNITLEEFEEYYKKRASQKRKQK